MRGFIDYLQEAFIAASGGNTYDTSYSNLDLNSRSLLHFPTPSGSRITLSSFVRPRFGTSYSIGIKEGWISYLYSTRPLTDPTFTTSSDRIPLQNLLRCYRDLTTRAVHHAVGHSLIYGRLYLPQNRLEALVASRVSRQVNLTLRAVSQERLRHGGTLLGLAQWDDPKGRFGVETLASSDGGVLGLRGLWNATNPASPTAAAPEPTAPPEDKELINGRFSVGGEIYYGLLNKSGGMSIGGRFQTLPTHAGTPLTATVTFNLLGHMSATYAVMAGDCTLASMFGFNVYSYESEWAVGMELWRKRRPLAAGAAMEEDEEEVVSATEARTADAALMNTSEMVGSRNEADPPPMAAMTTLEPIDTSTSITTLPSPPISPPSQTTYRERSFQAKLEWRLDDDDNAPEEVYDPTTGEKTTKDDEPEDEYPAGVLKCRCDQHMRLGLLYEGRYKSLLFSLGTDIDLKKLDAPFRGVGLAVQFSS
ncbi:Mitochondrial distribution and morphology protein 10 [Cytospora mali]|uniref:Mitochondrial distribution and morphology protein 10 n=1 Tax=Cytospora mali TaxID=578113 RepID=A0A194VNK0_CYTMA|nr:Mitochondrial distribution and morphology protein 10 [Valsa mali]